MKKKIIFFLMILFFGILLVQPLSIAQNKGPSPNLIIQSQNHVNIYSGEVSFVIKEFLTASQGPKLALFLNYNSRYNTSNNIS